MTNKQLIEKLKEDMEMRGFSHYTKDSYLRKAKEVIVVFKIWLFFYFVVKYKKLLAIELKNEILLNKYFVTSQNKKWDNKK